MQRASLLLRGMKLPGDTVTPDEIAIAVWPVAVGKTIAAHTRAVKLVRTRLVVEVEDLVWQRQLFALSGQILGALAKHVGRGSVEELQFRVAPRRREPQRAAAAAPGKAYDEADGIVDPVLRGIYRASRAKAGA
ncbi:MAG: DUF721 domain-containing protein [Bryobacteraceae bacterium]